MVNTVSGKGDYGIRNLPIIPCLQYVGTAVTHRYLPIPSTAKGKNGYSFVNLTSKSMIIFILRHRYISTGRYLGMVRYQFLLTGTVR